MTAASMDVDSPETGTENEDRVISVHPLAIVTMADQYTRITCGGSPLDPTAPVVGLLLGSSSTTGGGQQGTTTTTTRTVVLEIKDAEDIPVDASEAARQQVSLHQAVFPLNRVVGWYRVAAAGDDGNSDQPTAEDLKLTHQLEEHYNPNGNTDAATTTNRELFVFGLLQVQSAAKKRQKENSKMPAAGDEKEEEDDEEEELPLTLYYVDRSKQVLVALEDWTLQTSDPERIAVERVVREQPQRKKQMQQQQQQLQQQLQASSSHQQRRESASAGDKRQSKQPKPTPPQRQESQSSLVKQQQQAVLQCSHFLQQTHLLQQSLAAIQERMRIVDQFLRDTDSGKIPFDAALLREVQGLLLQLGPVAAATAAATDPLASSSSSSSQEHYYYQNPHAAAAQPLDQNHPESLLQQLAALAKTVDAVQSYTDKFRAVQESSTSNRPTLGSGREVRRF